MNNFIDTYLKAWRQYAVFTGRSNRSEYWVFTLANFAVVVVFRLLSGGETTSVHPFAASHMAVVMTGPHAPFFWVLVVFDLAALIPSLAVSVRRFHDLDHSGWWLLLSLVPVAGSLAILVWFCFRGTHGSNRFGPDPLGPDDNTSVIPNVPPI